MSELWDRNMALYGPGASRNALNQRGQPYNRSAVRSRLSVAQIHAPLYDRLASAREHRGDMAGEGAAMFILETRDSAARRGARIIAELDAIHCDDDLLRLLLWRVATQPMSAAYNLGRIEPSKPINITPARSSAEPTLPVVVSGVGVVSPLGDNFERFGHTLKAGVSATVSRSPTLTRLISVSRMHVKYNLQYGGERLPAKLKQRLARYDERSAGFAVSAALEAVHQAGLSTIPETVVHGTGLSSVSLMELEQDCIPYLTPTPPHLDASRLTVRAGNGFCSTSSTPNESAP